jgi:quercetin dioxygenase-like cupin family protein
MDYLRIWADEDGESHFEDVTLDRAVNPAERGVAELWVSPGVDVDRVQFLTVQAVDQVPAAHNAPRRQLVVFLDGWVRITTSDGETRTLPAGSVVLAEDEHGKGHVTELEPGVRRVLQIPLDSEEVLGGV